jgi:hypothetical protein
VVARAFNQYLLRDSLVIPDVKQNMMSFSGFASWAKVTSPGDKLTPLALPNLTFHQPAKSHFQLKERDSW